MKKITPCLWFEDDAEEAVAYYLDVFPNSEITQVTHYPEGMPLPAGSVLTISFTLNGNELTALNGGPAFQFSEAISLVVHCEDQEEIDHYWDRLVAGGTPMACGWLKDRYGLAWQIVPATFFEMIRSEDRERAARVLAAMQTMVKFDLAALEAAHRGA
jgi:predicted 3-demethylubiquinone-9 3-methyltransferase (glyoxalase superfamily)